MVEGFPKYLSVNYRHGEEEGPGDYPSLLDKMDRCVDTCLTGLEQYENPAVMWTGGKDSTLVLYAVNEVAEETGREKPTAVLIDHFQHFEETLKFVERWAGRFGIDVHYARNEDVAAQAEKPGDEIRVEDLNEQNRREVRAKLGYGEETFPFLLDSYVGNHLLKTVALNDALGELEIDGVFSGIRWDEQEARADETFFSPRHETEKYPPHDRIHPILQFEERAVWDATWRYVVPNLVEGYPEGHVPQSRHDLPEGVDLSDLPVSPKYFEGFRSLGSETGTVRGGDGPAWLQELETTTERAGRAQDKEDLMQKLRDLGYM
ncbi:MAG: Sulfate adenylyltransferase subunit 2 [Methanonatronarchaeales archaeon]|nr:Sulfate adenylyltransferase subunit 2 [Methanonatronarchaeales archaeon]